jgi:protein TonB
LKKERKEDSFIKNPYYKGGNQALSAFVQANLIYPVNAEIPIEGTVIVKYDVDHLGTVVDARVIKSLGSNFDEEALRVVRLLKFEVPKTPRKLKVIFHKDIHIHFKPNAAPVLSPAVQPPPTQWVYQVTTSTSTVKEATPARVITYTLKIDPS